jgi:hypothetical protein
VNENASSANDCQFMVEMRTSVMSIAAASPTAQPRIASATASRRNATRIAPRRNPSARKEPISAVRFATEAYIVIMAPIIAPTEKITDSVSPRMRMKFESTSDCSS